MQAFLLVVLLLFAGPSSAATVNASSCSEADVASAISTANAGDTVAVPAGSCTWSSLSINKAVHVQGAGTGVTNITLGAGNSVTKQANGVGNVRITDFSFTKNSGGNESYGWSISGPWPTGDLVIIQNNEFNVSSSALFSIGTPGGVIIANNDFTANWDDSLIKPKDQSGTASWTTADTMGDRDTTGKNNIYVETNTFYGGTNQGIDCDEQARCVYRYNTLTYSSFNTHGWATSPSSVRHFEVYENNFIHNGGTDQIANQNWAIWIRGGTGLIYNNDIDDIAGGYWGDKNELRFTIRGAEDTRPQGACGDVSYPVPQQIGQNHNGTSYFTDPIYIYGNTGTQAIFAGWNWGNPCGFTFSDFWQENRDYVLSGPKPGYTAYTYPHPALASGPTPTASLTANPSTIAYPGSSDLSWTSTDATSCTGTGFSTGGATSGGPVSVSPSTTTVYEIDCVGAGGSANDTAQVTVTGGPTPPTATLTANPTAISSGGSSDLTWSSTDATSCTGTNFSTGGATSGGPVSVSPTVTTVYEVDCTGAGGSANDTAQVTVSATYAPLPTGDNGIAAGYTNDVNISTDPDVIWHDDFESYANDAALDANYGRWQTSNVGITSSVVANGLQALEIIAPQSGSNIANAISRAFSPTEDVVYIRVNTQFAAGFDGLVSPHTGIRLAASYPGPGTPPDGTDFFLTIFQNEVLESEAQPGAYEVYIYHPYQRDNWGDHFRSHGVIFPQSGTPPQWPGGWGDDFVSRPNTIPAIGSWHSLEVMVQMNTTGVHDGRLAIWVDGVVVADWHNILLRDTGGESMEMDNFQLEHGAQTNASGPDVKYYDDLVVARDYIGPVYDGAVDTTPPGPVLNLQIEQVSP